MKPELYKTDDGSEGWVVEHCDPDDDGRCDKAVFYGPEAERQAVDFLRYEYGQVARPKRQFA
jgi:hypothetical protein